MNPLPPNGIRWARGTGSGLTLNYIRRDVDLINPVDTIIRWEREP